jgi:hypothetical protein
MSDAWGEEIVIESDDEPQPESKSEVSFRCSEEKPFESYLQSLVNLKA